MRNKALAGVAAAMALVITGCGKSDRGIRMEGSDTMVNLAQAWAEKYHAEHPEVTVQVLGGGTGVGIASLIDGNCDMTNASRAMEEKEIERVKAKRGVAPVEHIVGYDALAVYVHKDNPLESISLEELAEIYGDGGKITKWSQLGVDSSAMKNDEITRVGRQNSSGTYAYFREVILGKGRDYKLGSIDQNGSKDVVELITHTPTAIGYSGMGFTMPGVKMLAISKHKGEPGVPPTMENAKKKQDGYPITRSLLIYTVGELTGQSKDFLDWILAPAGQKMVVEMGYVPEKDHE